MEDLPTCSKLGYATLIPSFCASTIPWALLFRKVPHRHGVGLLERVHTFYHASRIGIGIEIVSAVFSVISCGTFIAGTYLENSEPAWFFPLEVGFSTFFMVYFLFTLLIEHNRLAYLMSLHSFVDVTTVTPVLVTLFLGWCELSFSVFAFARVLKFARVFRLLRAVRSFELLTDTAEDAIKKQTMRLVSLIVILIMVSTGFMQYVANEIGGEIWQGVHQLCSFDSAAVCAAQCEEECLRVSTGGEEPYWTCLFLPGGTKYRSGDESEFGYHPSLVLR